MNAESLAPPPFEPIAIVGLACRFPGGADDPESFWSLLCEGRDAIGPVPADRWSVRRFYHPDPDRPGKAYIREAGFLTQDLAGIDAGFFGLSPKEARCMDPQQRLLLEVAWEAFEDAGLPLESLAGRDVGTYIGGFMLDHEVLTFSPANRALIESASATGTTLGMLANRLAHAFDLRGPSLTLDTACSSSLVALHTAVSALRLHQCEVALVGGVNVLLKPEPAIAMCKGRYLSADARCRAFDARASGYARGEGAGVLVLKRLADAVAAQDAVRAVILGTGVNQDGRTPGLSNPSAEAQAALMRRVSREAGIAPADVTYAEAHGTGTQAGDRAEARSLGAVYGAGREPSQALLVGSVKTHIGHLEAAAGAAGLIKTVLALERRTLPGNLHFETPNPEIPFAALGLQVVDSTRPWPAWPAWPADRPRLAAVNSFGYGGTNAHVILAAYGGVRTGPPAEGPGRQVLTVSARSEAALRELADRYARVLAETPAGPALTAVCATACRRRSHLDRRLAVCGSSGEEMAGRLRAFAAGEPAEGIHENDRAALRGARLAFVYTGMGPQTWSMGRGLDRRFPAFREEVERCDEALRRCSGESVLAALRGHACAGDAGDGPLRDPRLAQPANFLLQMGLTALWRSLGVAPDAVVGHSVGEIAAACAAGALSLDDAAAVIFHRSRLLASLAGLGTMLAAALSAEEAERYLDGRGGEVSIAAVNGRRSVTLTGAAAPLEEIAGALRQSGIFHRFLDVALAYHSAQMDAVRDDLVAALAGLRPRPATVPFYSTVTGALAGEAALDAAYWWRNAREPVAFAGALDAAIDSGCRLFLEVGPHPVLAAPVRDALLARRAAGHAVASLRRGSDAEEHLLDSLARLHTLGVAVDWAALYPAGRPAALPSYPWQRERHWLEAAASRADRMGTCGHPLLGEREASPGLAYRAEISLQALPYLADHKVGRRAVLPAAAYVEAGLALLEASGETGPGMLEDLTFERPLTLGGAGSDTAEAADVDDLEVELRCALDESTRELTIHAAARREPPEPHSWTLHATGRAVFRPAPELPEPPAGLEAVAELRRRCPEPLDPAAFYQGLAARGLSYGPSFRRLLSLGRGEGEVFFDLAPLPAAEGEEGYRIHPALLDACLQAAFAGFGESGLWLPAAIGRVRCFAPRGPLAAGHVRLVRRERSAVACDVLAFDAQGQAVLEMKEAVFKPLPAAAGRRTSPASDLLYEHVWVKASPVPGSELAPTEVVLADDGLRGPEAAEQLRSLGCPVTVAAAPVGFEDLAGRTSRLCTALAAIVRGGLERQPPGGGRMIWITRNAVQVAAGDRVDPAQASLWGLARVVRNEHPELRLQLVDLGAEDGTEAASFLVRELLPAGYDEECALRGGTVFAHRLVRWSERAGAAPQRVEVSLDETPLRLGLGAPEVWCESRTDPAAGEAEVRLELLAPLPAPLRGAPQREDQGRRSRRALWVGRIVRLGKGVEGWREGDRAVGILDAGSVRSLFTAPVEGSWLPFPGEPSPELVAWLPLLAAAWHVIEDVAGLGSGRSALIGDGCGPLGQACAAVARLRGVRVSAEAGGAHAFDAVLLPAGGTLPRSALASLKPFGRIVLLNGVSGGRHWTLLPRVEASLTVATADLAWLIREQPAVFERALAGVLAAFEGLRSCGLEARRISLAGGQGLADALGAGAAEDPLVIDLREPRVRVALSEPDTVEIDPRATYLVAGGLGGLGLATARWLVSKGARCLALLGRRGRAEGAAAAEIEAMARQGVRVETIAADLADAEAVARAVERIRESLPSLRGVFHSAMVLDDAPVTALDESRMARVLAPKVDGIWNLHRATLGLGLDFFVAYGSVSCWLGNPGQGNYAAANAFLDGFAQYRRNLGLPAAVVHWGAIAEVGAVARDPRLGDHLRRLGLAALAPGEALALLDLVLARRLTQVGAFDVDWARWAEGAPAQDGQRLRLVLPSTRQARQAQREERQESLRRSLAGLPPEDCVERIGSILRSGVAELLAERADRLDPHRRLIDLGVDSLAAAEIGAFVRNTFGVEVGVFDLLADLDLAGLGSLILERMALLPPGTIRAEGLLRELTGPASKGRTAERRADLGSPHRSGYLV